MVFHNPHTLETLLRDHAQGRDNPVRVIIQPQRTQRHVAIELETQTGTHNHLISRKPKLQYLDARISEGTRPRQESGMRLHAYTWEFGSPHHAELETGPFYFTHDSRANDVRDPLTKLTLSHPPTPREQKLMRKAMKELNVQGIAEHMYEEPDTYFLRPQRLSMKRRAQHDVVSDLYNSDRSFKYSTCGLTEGLLLKQTMRHGIKEFSQEIHVRPRKGLFGPAVSPAELERVHEFLLHGHDDLTDPRETYAIRLPLGED